MIFFFMIKKLQYEINKSRGPARGREKYLGPWEYSAHEKIFDTNIGVSKNYTLDDLAYELANLTKAEVIEFISKIKEGIVSKVILTNNIKNQFATVSDNELVELSMLFYRNTRK